ncbi:MAG: class I SAM-dependent methyltransferase [archaeon]|nr:class I SAM-dependent methyltransferase [archaeon]
MAAQIHKISKINLFRDKNVLGAMWSKTYNNYFSNQKNIDLFVNKIINYIPAKNKIKILYPCSGTGLLGEALIKKLKRKGIGAQLFLIDISKKQLNENHDPKTIKIQQDVLKMKQNELFDVIIMRSSLDYFPTEKLQIKVLSNLNNCLESNGVFFNQTASMPTLIERNLADKIYKSNKKIGKRHFQCQKDIVSIYKKAGFSEPKKLGLAKPLIVTEQEHIERYKINYEEIKRIQKIIQQVSKTKNVEITKNGYKMKFIFPIYATWKKSLKN